MPTPRKQTELTRQLDFVLPLAEATHGQDEIDRARILLQSIAHFLEPGSLRTFWIVTEPDKVDRMRQRLAEFSSLPLRVIDQQDLIGHVPQLRGWEIQQLIKLAIAALTTEYYLVLDADCLLRKPLGFDQLVPAGRGLVSLQAKTIHERWWERSAEILGLPVNPAAEGIGVTPQVLSSTVVHHLMDALQERYQRPWQWILQRHRGWTEFTLYSLIAQQSLPFEQFHQVGTLKGNNLWRNGNRSEFQIDRHAPGFFSVIQSNTGISPREVARKVRGVSNRNFGAESSSMSTNPAGLSAASRIDRP